MISILRKRIKDEKFLRLIRKFLNAGYMENNKYHNTYSGAVQGGIISPILANIYLDQFDKYMKEYKEKFDKGKKRTVLKSYTKMGDKRHRIVAKINKETDEAKRKILLTELKEHDEIYHSMPRSDAMDSTFKRLQYTRYADDFLIGVIGSKKDAEIIKNDIALFLSDRLKLELSQEKTLITIATDKARFLGFDIRARKQSRLKRKTKRGCYARNYGGHIVLEAPTELIKKKLLSLGAMEIKVVNDKEIWKPKARKSLCCKQDIYILNQYNSEVRGICNYYAIANNSSKLHKFRYIMEYSMYKTFACKYRTTKADIIERYRLGKDFAVKYKDYKGNEKVRVFWKGSLARNDFPKDAEVDIVFSSKPVTYKNNPSLAKRLKANTCEWCGKYTADVVMHQVRTLKDLDKSLPLISNETATAKNKLRQIEKRVKTLLEMIKYAERYQSTLSIYQSYKKAKNPEAFLQKHESEIILHGGAKRMLEQAGITIKNMNVQKLKAELSTLEKQKGELAAIYKGLAKNEKELQKQMQKLKEYLRAEKEENHERKQEKHSL